MPISLKVSDITNGGEIIRAMEIQTQSYDLESLEREISLLPVVSPAKPLLIPAPKKNGLADLMLRAATHPVARLGLAAAAFGVGAFLSNRKPASRRKISSPQRQCEDEEGGWMVTAVVLRLNSDCEQILIWRGRV